MLQRTTFLQPEPSLVQTSVHVARPRRLFRNGASNAAAIRAVAGAQLYLGKKVRTLAKAARVCSSNVAYVRGAILLIETESRSLLEAVLAGQRPLLEAADLVRLKRKTPRLVSVDQAVAAWRSWSPGQRAEFGRGAGISEIWDCAISPVISEERVAAE
jgi:hypothetical protein